MSKIKLSLLVLSLFIFGLFFVNIQTVKANELRGSYDYYKELFVDNNSYSLRINKDVNILNSLLLNDFNHIVNCNILYNDVIYTRLVVNNSDARGTLQVYLSTSGSDRNIIFEYMSGEVLVDFNERLMLYNNINYAIILNPVLNKIFIFENYILGHYVFNTELVGVSFGQYDFIEPSQDFKITGTLTYPFDNYYLFSSFTAQINTPQLTIDFYNPRGERLSYDLDNELIENNDYVRYFYFDGQYIDNNLYEFLKINGSFRYSLPSEAYNYTFWDLVNSYVNIPVTMISSLLNISIFGTSATLMLIFSTIIIILLAFKVGKMLAWF